MRKIKLKKIVGNFLDKLRKLYMNGKVNLEIFSPPHAIENSKQLILASANRYFTEKSRAPGAPGAPGGERLEKLLGFGQNASEIIPYCTI